VGGAAVQWTVAKFKLPENSYGAGGGSNTHKRGQNVVIQLSWKNAVRGGAGAGVRMAETQQNEITNEEGKKREGWGSLNNSCG